MSDPDIDDFVLIDDFEYLERYTFNNRLQARTHGCGCCSCSDEIPEQDEQQYIKRYIENLRAEIAVWEKELDAE